MLINLKNKDTLIIDDFKLKCCIGKKGLKKHKIEGDKSTPKGIFTISTIYYRKDKVDKPLKETWDGAMIQIVNFITKKLK